MRGKSHEALGQYLLREYAPELSPSAKRAFLIGCIEPDRNPTTYLKGSIRNHWMRGHNYNSANRLISRLAVRLERKRLFSLWDYYSLGKLMHYSTDAFTYAHNEHFPKNLPAHRLYEVSLQIFFLRHLSQCRKPTVKAEESCANLLRRMHEQYMHLPGAVEIDTAYAFAACCQLMWKLTENQSECQKYQFQSEENNDIIEPIC